MADTYEFYLTQAAAAGRAAEQAGLENVRINYQRAEKVWLSLADKAQSVAVARATREAAVQTRPVAAAVDQAEPCEV
jgi:16S rRNA G527 N7-methylase RsmG